MRRFASFFLCAFLLANQLSYAQTLAPLEQLRSNNVAQVEAAYAGLQKRFEAGSASEYELLDAYKAFYQRQDQYRAEFGNWIKRYPASASAYLARGVYYRKLGEFTRGTSYISQVPQENIAYMQRMHQLAKEDLATSLRLNPKSYITILHLLNIAQFESDDRAADKYLALGNAVLPSNFLLRARYLIHLTPKWGGSHQKMKLFIERCRSEGLSQDKLDMLNAIRFEDQGSVAEAGGNTDQARAEYVKALVAARSSGKRFRQDYLRGSAAICEEPEHKGKDYCS
jgi:tetratricopeptide (TPR) repeat protein